GSASERTADSSRSSLTIGFKPPSPASEGWSRRGGSATVFGGDGKGPAARARRRIYWWPAPESNRDGVAPARFGVACVYQFRQQARIRRWRILRRRPIRQPDSFAFRRLLRPRKPVYRAAPTINLLISSAVGLVVLVVFQVFFSSYASILPGLIGFAIAWVVLAQRSMKKV